MLIFKKIACFFAALAIFCPSATTAPAPESLRLPVLMYHHLLRAQGRQNAYVITPEELEGDLEYLIKQGYSFVSLGEVAAWRAGEGTLPAKPVLLTFDDGYESFSAYALPVLEKYGARAAVFAVGKFTELYSGTDDHNINYSHLSWTALRALAEGGTEIGGHSFDMHDLRRRRGCARMKGEGERAYRAALNADLAKMEELFLQNSGIELEFFAYPYGAYCKISNEVLEERGYKIALTCEERVNAVTPGEGLLVLGRFNRPHGIDRAAFFGKWK